MRKIKVGIIQQANTSDIRMNLMNLAIANAGALVLNEALKLVPLMAHNSSFFRNFIIHCIFAKLKILIYLNWRNRFRDLLQDSIPNWRQLTG